MSNVRGCAQEVISAHLLHGDEHMRDALIDEYIEEFGPELLHCLFDFIHIHAVEDLDEQVAVAKFNFLLNHLGELIEHVAAETDTARFDLTTHLASSTYADVSEVDGRGAALRAAQTCLIIHMLVRQGGQPWGVQQNLDLVDMCAVTQILGDMLWTFVNGMRAEVGEAFLVKELLPRVEDILHRSASAQNMTIESVLGDYWATLALLDCRQD